jgi:uncharacterized protein involved in exopolysaccharide biosynthesis
MFIVDEQTRAMSDKTSEVKQKHQAAVKALLQRYVQLRSEVANYNKNLGKAMQQQQAFSAAVASADVRTGRDQS